LAALAVPPRRSEVPDAFVDEVAAALREAERPVVIAGTGAYMHHADEALEALADAGNLPVFTIDLGHGMLAGHPSAMGYADPALNGAARLIADADFVLLLGKWLDFRLRFGSPAVIAADAILVQVTADATELGRNRQPTLGASGDIAAFTAALTGRVAGGRRDLTVWCEKLATAVGPPSVSGAAPTADALHPHDVARTLAACLPAKASLALDAGDFVAWCRSVLKPPGPGRWLRLGPMSTCGAAVPMALGLKRAHPDEPVIVITGDGSLGYHLIEFEAAARQGIPFVTIVGNNRSWGIEQIFQRELYGEDYVRTTVLSDVRYDQVVRALGGYGERVTSLAELPAALERALASGVPACLDIPVALVRSSLAEGIVARGGEM
jgi:acetolactate synthase-1/2/3 large subunit